jgi:hypothetical protein
LSDDAECSVVATDWDDVEPHERVNREARRAMQRKMRDTHLARWWPVQVLIGVAGLCVVVAMAALGAHGTEAALLRVLGVVFAATGLGNAVLGVRAGRRLRRQALDDGGRDGS